jgi:hypothetical protein
VNPAPVARLRAVGVLALVHPLARGRRGRTTVRHGLDRLQHDWAGLLQEVNP